MQRGKAALLVALTLSLGACSAQPSTDASISPSPTTNETSAEVSDPFGANGIELNSAQPDFRNLLSAIVQTCKRSIADGVSGHSVNANNELQPSFVVMPAKNIQDHNQWYNQIKFENGQWGVGLWGDGDPLCSEAEWAADSLKKPAMRKNSALLQENKILSYGNGYFSLAIHRGGPDMKPWLYQVSDGVIVAYSSNTWASRLLLTLGLSPEDEKLYSKVLNDTGNTNAHLTGEIVGLSQEAARQIIEDAGLVFYVAMIDNAPVDDAATDSNPNRVNVNLIDGVVVGAWLG